MNPMLRRQLNEIESRLGLGDVEPGVIFVQLDDDTTQEFGDRIDRWCAGETVEAMPQQCTGRESCIIEMHIVDPGTAEFD